MSGQAGRVQSACDPGRGRLPSASTVEPDLVDHRLIHSLDVAAMGRRAASADAGARALFQVSTLDARLPSGTPACALRVDGDFERLELRSVARQPPGTSLAKAARQQHAFELRDVSGTLVGFRFPDYAQGLEVAGYHLHFADAARRRGGHVLACRPARVQVGLDPEGDLHVELPPGIELGPPDRSADERARIREAEEG